MSFRRIEGFVHLPASERKLLLSAVCWLPLTGLALRLFGLRRTYAWMERRVDAETGPRPDTCGIDEVRSIVRSVARAERPLPYRVSCLRKSLVLWWLLACRGCSPRLLVGVGKPQSGFEAHAWVEWQDLVLNDDQGIRERFVPIEWRMSGEEGQLAR